MRSLSDLKNRLVVSIGVIAVFFTLVFFSNLLFMRFIVAIAICFIASIAAMEFLDLAKQKKVDLSRPLFLGAVICQIIAFFIYSQYTELKILPLIVFLFFIAFLFGVNFKQIENSFIRISTSSFGFIYIAIIFGMILPILFLNTFETQDGRYWVFYLIFVTKLSDIGAYFGGKLFGKTKLAAKISPKKTIFGSVSGLVLSLLGSLVFLFFSKRGVFDFNISEAIFLGLILGVFAQFGDLSESLLKRDAKIKDSSKIPGLGGILDLMDSLMFNIPIMYCFLIG